MGFIHSSIVPFKKSNSLNFIQFQALMAVGIGLSGLLISTVLGYPLNFNAYGFLSGVLWATANAISLVAVLDLGLSRAVPVMSSLVVTSSFLWGALAFNELPAGLGMGFLGIGLIILGVILVSSTGNMESQNIRKGLLAAIFAGLIWGSQLVPLKMGSVATKDFFFPVCLGILISGLIIFALSPSVILSVAKNLFKSRLPRLRLSLDPRNGRQAYPVVGLSLLSGLIWNIGNLLSLISLSLIGLSKMGPISQSASLVAVLWGLFYFKEITRRKKKMQVLIGAVILISGVITLGTA